MALGHAFSHEREHDQAFNAYLMAEKEMRGWFYTKSLLDNL